MPNFWLKASLRLWAGSVEMSSTERRTLASWMASEHEVVVLPTPPFPPTKIQRSDRWSRIDCRVGSMASGSSALMSAVDMVAVGRRMEWCCGVVSGRTRRTARSGRERGVEVGFFSCSWC